MADVCQADLAELRPARWNLGTEEAQYWIQEEHVRWKDGTRIGGADVATFVFYRSGFARDARRAYCRGRRLSNSVGATFRALNYCYHSDSCRVWTLGGEVKDADANTTVACDRGFRELSPTARVPSGYAKDAKHVFYYGFEGRATILRPADVKSFESLGDCVFGRDARHVYCRKKILKKADPRTWRMLLGGYSRDACRAFYDDREMVGIDPDQLWAHPISETDIQLARVGDVYYRNDREISEREYHELLEEYNEST